MAAPPKHHHRRNPHIWRTPYLESLETRLPFAADLNNEPSTGAYFAASQSAGSRPLALNVHQGVAQSGITSNPITITGYTDQQFFDAHPIVLSDGSHLLLTRTTESGLTSIRARFTKADGTPGPAAIPIAELNITSFPSTLQDTSWQLNGVELADGSIIAIWSDETGLYSQRFNTNGELLGGAIQYAVATVPHQFQVTALAQDDGTHWIGWVDSVNQTFEVRQVDAEGTILDSIPLGSLNAGISLQEFWLITDASDLPTAVWISEDNFGNSTLTWQSIDSVKTTPQSIPLTGITQVHAIRTVANGWAITGIRTDGTDLQAVLIVTDELGVQLSERLLGILPSNQDPPTIELLENGEWLVSYFQSQQANLELAYRWFSRSGEPIGTGDVIPAIIDRARGALIPLSNDTFVAYWSGLALNGTDLAIMAQHIGIYRTPLHFGIDERLLSRPESELALIIKGLPQTAGLSSGSLQSDGHWLVGLDQLDGLEILSYEELGPLELELSLIDIQDPANPLHSQPNFFGSPFDDLFPLPEGHSHIDGRQGNDRVSVAGFSDAFVASRLNDRTITFQSIDETFTALLEEIESLEFLDGTFDVDAFLATHDMEALFESVDEEGGEEVTTLPGPSSTNSLPTESAPLLIQTPAIDVHSIQSFPLGIESIPSIANISIVSLGNLTEAPVSSTISQTITNHSTQGTLQTTVIPSLSANPGGALEVRLQPARSGEAEQAGHSIALVTSGSPSSGDNQIEHETETTGFVTEEVMLTHAVIAAPSLTPSTTNEAFVGGILENIPQRSDITSWQIGADLPSRLRFASSEELTVSAAFNGRALMETFEEETSESNETSLKPIVVGSAIVLATGFSLAQIVWLMRGSALLTKTLSSAPLWIAFDPLPIVNPHDGDPTQDTSPQNSETLLDIAQARS